MSCGLSHFGLLKLRKLISLLREAPMMTSAIGVSKNSSFLQSDPLIADAIQKELARQQNQIEMIASENFTSLAVMEAQGSVMTNKYAEGYPGRRYYGGCEFVDVVETAAIERACKLYGCNFANVQPHSGAQANEAVFLALMSPGDTFLGMDLNSGGHLTHGSKVNVSGKWFNPVGYGLDENGYIDMDQVERLAKQHRPKVIIAGGSAYSRFIDFLHFRRIANNVGAYLMVDMAHFSGLVAGGIYPNPLGHAHVVTSTTHKTLRGPRGGMILWNDETLTKKINSAVFPGNQGGPLMHVIAAKAVAFKEALDPSFGKYAKQVQTNARVLSDVMAEKGFRILSGGTDSHMVLVDLTPFNLSGRDAENALERAGITCNKNSIPNDPLPPQKSSGIRLGSPAPTTRGFQEDEFRQIGLWIYEVISAQSSNQAAEVEGKVRTQVTELCARFPLYPELSC